MDAHGTSETRSSNPVSRSRDGSWLASGSGGVTSRAWA